MPRDPPHSVKQTPYNMVRPLTHTHTLRELQILNFISKINLDVTLDETT